MNLPAPTPEKMIVDQIINCFENDTVFGKRWWSQVIEVTDADLAALKTGKYLALDANGEYIVYLRLKDSLIPDTKRANHV